MKDRVIEKLPCALYEFMLPTRGTLYITPTALLFCDSRHDNDSKPCNDSIKRLIPLRDVTSITIEKYLMRMRGSVVVRDRHDKEYWFIRLPSCRLAHLMLSHVWQWRMDGSDYKLRESEFLRAVRNRAERGKVREADDSSLLLKGGDEGDGDGDRRDERSDSGDRIIRKGIAAMEAGQSTIDSLSRQDETVASTHEALGELDYDMRVSDRVLRGMSRHGVSLFGTAKNLATIANEPHPRKTTSTWTDKGKNTMYIISNSYEIIFTARNLRYRYDKRLIVMLDDRIELVHPEKRSVLRRIPYVRIRSLELIDVGHCIMRYSTGSGVVDGDDEHFEMFSIFLNMIMDDLCTINRAILVLEGPEMQRRKKNDERKRVILPEHQDWIDTDDSIAKTPHVLKPKRISNTKAYTTMGSVDLSREEILPVQNQERKKKEDVQMEKLGEIGSLAQHMKSMALAINDKLDDSNQRLDTLNRHAEKSIVHVYRNTKKIDNKL